MCNNWYLGLRCWCTVGWICSIFVAGRRLEDFIPLPLIHCITYSNVNVVVYSYITLIEYNIALNSDGAFLQPVYLIALRLQIVANKLSNLGACIKLSSLEVLDVCSNSEFLDAY